MKYVANRITNFIVKHGAIGDKDFEVYEYGFLIGLEAGICVLVTITEAFLFGMVIEWFFFFMTFIPLRSYAGGLHLSRFSSCLLLSNAVFLIVLGMSRKLSMEPGIMFFYIILLSVCIYSLYPIENSNREVTPKEKLIIRQKFNKVICGLLLISTIMFILSYEKGLKLQLLTLLMLAITMAVGKLLSMHQNLFS